MSRTRKSAGTETLRTGWAIPFPHFPDLALALLQSLRKASWGEFELIPTQSYSFQLLNVLLNSSAQLFLVRCLFMLLAYVCLCTVCVCLIALLLQLFKDPRKSTWAHLESQVEGIKKQHNVQIQEELTKAVFHTACSLSFTNAREVRIKEQGYKDCECLQSPKGKTVLLA